MVDMWSSENCRTDEFVGEIMLLLPLIIMCAYIIQAICRVSVFAWYGFKQTVASCDMSLMLR